MVMGNRHLFFVRVQRAVCRVLVACAAAVLVTGCASGISTKVTTFQQWPSDTQPHTYTLVDPPGEVVSRLEYSAYQDMLRAAIGVAGLVEAQAGQAARFLISFHYGSDGTQRVRREPADSAFYGGFYGGWPWSLGGYYRWPTWVAVSENAWRNVLVVEIRDTQRDGDEVYRATASAVSTHPDELASLMPYLMRAVFDGFPGNNGQMRDVRYPRDKPLDK